MGSTEVEMKGWGVAVSFLFLSSWAVPQQNIYSGPVLTDPEQLQCMDTTFGCTEGSNIPGVFYQEHVPASRFDNRIIRVTNRGQQRVELIFESLLNDTVQARWVAILGPNEYKDQLTPAGSEDDKPAFYLLEWHAVGYEPLPLSAWYDVQNDPSGSGGLQWRWAGGGDTGCNIEYRDLRTKKGPTYWTGRIRYTAPSPNRSWSDPETNTKITPRRTNADRVQFCVYVQAVEALNVTRQ